MYAVPPPRLPKLRRKKRDWGRDEATTEHARNKNKLVKGGHNDA